MPTLSAYRVYSDQQLAKAIIRLRNEVESRTLSAASMGDRNYQVALDRLDKQFQQACLAWKERGGTTLPESETDTPGGGNRLSEPNFGGTSYDSIGDYDL